MKKFLHSLMALFVGVTTAAFAQQDEAWNGTDKVVELELSDSVAFVYDAAERGRLYIYSDTATIIGKVAISISGGLWTNGAYNADFLLQETGYYGNGEGVYGWIDVREDDKIRFTLTAADEAIDEMSEITEFTLKSMFFPQTGMTLAGSNWENPVVLTEGKKKVLPTFINTDKEMLDNDHITFCEFTASKTCVAEITTNEYVVYCVDKSKYGEKFTNVVEDEVKKNLHEMMVEEGKSYIVAVPNSRPTEITFKTTNKKVGQSAKFPKTISEFPVTLDLVKGDNFYAFSHELIGNTNMLEIATADWNGTITYMENHTEKSTELVADSVAGAATFVKNVDTRYLLYGDKVIVNFNMTDKSSLASAATLKLRTPKSGESFGTAAKANYGENTINGLAGDYWFAYTAVGDSVYSFKTSGTIKHVNFIAGVEQKVADNIYRVDAGETIYVCVTTTTNEGNTFTVSGKEIADGEYCDRPIYFELGQDITIAGYGVDCYHSFIAEENGFAVFTSTNWSVHFREECGGRRLNPEETITEDGGDIIYTYKLPVNEGQSYIVEVNAVSEDITVSTSFESANYGDVCATAVTINELDKKISIDYTFEAAKWYKYTANKDGFYTIKAKLGYAANMTTKVGDCDAAEINAGNDNEASNAYMGGYKAAKVYLAEGNIVYIYTKTGRSNDETEFSAEFYLSVSYAGEARSGEDAAVAIQAVANKEYTVMKNDAEGYEQWYTYTIPAEKEAVFALSTVVKYFTNNFSFYREDKTTTMSTGKGDYTQENITNEKNETIGKRITFAAADEARTIFFKLSTVNAKFYPDPVVWQIICDDNTGIEVEEVAPEAAVIYDLMGRRVDNPTKGIYIINGVKRVIK